MGCAFKFKEASAGERALPWLYQGLNRDFGAIEPHSGNHPPAVAKALFGLLLAPWEDWVSLETDWSGFNVPWIHLATDDPFVRPQPAPSADTLTWVDASAQIGEDEFIEFQRAKLKWIRSANSHTGPQLWRCSSRPDR